MCKAGIQKWGWREQNAYVQDLVCVETNYFVLFLFEIWQEHVFKVLNKW